MNKETTNVAAQAEAATAAPQAAQSPTNRRKFLTGAAATAAGATAVLAAPNVSRAQTVTIKMQGAWAQQDILNEFAEDYVSRVNEMGGDRLKIDYLVSGAVVKAFSVYDAVHSRVLDAGHTVPAYVYGKNKAASLFGTGPCLGWDAHQAIAWIYFGGGAALHQELMQDILGFNIVSFFSTPMPPQPLGWFKNEIKSVDDMKGMKYRTVGLATEVFQKMGVAVTQTAGRRDRPGDGKGRDRRLRIQQPELGPAARRPGRRQELHARQLPPAQRVLRDHLQQGGLRRAGCGAAGDPEVCQRGGVVGHLVEGVRSLFQRSARVAGGGRRYGTPHAAGHLRCPARRLGPGGRDNCPPTRSSRG